MRARLGDYEWLSNLLGKARPADCGVDNEY
jgi:hypothetical protein